MDVAKPANVDTVRARRMWAEFQKQHDLTGREGQTAGVDPSSGRIWFGESIGEVVAKRDADSCGAPLYFVRVGSPTYYRKGRR